MTEKRRTTATLASAKRLIVKIGSALLVDEKSGGIRRKWLDALADDVAAHADVAVAAVGVDAAAVVAVAALVVGRLAGAVGPLGAVGVDRAAAEPVAASVRLRELIGALERRGAVGPATVAADVPVVGAVGGLRVFADEGQLAGGARSCDERERRQQPDTEGVHQQS